MGGAILALIASIAGLRRDASGGLQMALVGTMPGIRFGRVLRDVRHSGTDADLGERACRNAGAIARQHHAACAPHKRRHARDQPAIKPPSPSPTS
ncbi:hypothetical protein D5R55_36980 [Burkholderia cenocepacia]|uniref:Uncharacterized protein n=1 Tax=Burkholderia cenocepacia TaxID=95486 RepID=A0A3S9NKZ1_9BURK|nr:hypothetical protein D5R55_36980 [Burkholderia cenocepacia]